jgi:hydroxyacyl-ACP dehydratase HTD2-like protein with hotdog domain
VINIYDFCMSINIEHLKQWIGRTESLADWVTPPRLQSLAATLDREDRMPEPGDAVPACWHWLYFLPVVRQSEIGPDTHPHRGGFLPPMPLPRRMWAGSRLEWSKPLRVGQAMTKNSCITDGRVGTEGYPGLVVHGHLRATLLLDLLRRQLPHAQVTRFALRAMKPTFDLEAFKVCGARAQDGKTIRLWAKHLDGALAMDATATVA